MDDERTAVARTTVDGRDADAGAGLPGGLLVRHPVPEDHGRLQVALADWWGGLGGEAGALQRQLLVPRLFLQHFAGTSFLVERPDHTLHAFLIGFLSQTDSRTAYIHFVGVCPDGKRAGVGGFLYRRFFAAARAAGRTRIRCITSPNNRDSLAYHRRMGFRLEPGDRIDEHGVPVHRDYDGPGLDRVSFVRDLPAGPGDGPGAGAGPGATPPAAAP
ncbi:GNAT family N-acetyltransferase [Streptomyces lydicus]|uniref:GNAT family N-acetyltransferase n=1 Tax=Streptomyces lydicus TaxID=47763 RepID=A0A1D7VTY4_9ACTN|nr:GNAT family N-acetyltransferase [Streptomyces lydicus]AOP50187.1 GNAT family N-acetyltransferase [Streptomyces lydicus]